jgi:threonyl-tRNA synthetase
MEQIAGEIRGAFEFLEAVYKPFGFTFKVGLSTRNPSKWMGDLKVWDNAEATLRSVLEEKMPGAWHVNEEDAAFYGPKVSSGFCLLGFCLLHMREYPS